ncbi:MAG: hypothetical protein D4S01_10135 [Dehalococcoidia bacterium]|nr:MAG: hypothetical protein D4S01_10135 [Dehalococcoidia bacterium]
MGDGADYGQEEAYEDNTYLQEMEQESMEKLYQEAKSAPKGSTVECPVCHRVFLKKHPAQAFCGHNGKRTCKDRFHNFTNEE